MVGYLGPGGFLSSKFSKKMKPRMGNNDMKNNNNDNNDERDTSRGERSN